MNTSASTLILHHYNESPYAEKIRSLLGYKGLAWQSVITPKQMPKPDLTAMTGGYRKVPVLQIGADVYCDTRLITQVIEERHPLPATTGTSWSEVVAHWVDANLFGKAVAFTFSQIIDFLDDAFLADRAAMSGRSEMTRDMVKLSGPLARQTLTTELQWVEQGLSAGAPFVNGTYPGHGDFALYCALWFARFGRFDFSRLPATDAWMKRMKALGQGARTEISAEVALDTARDATPQPLTYECQTPDPAGIALGMRVSVQPEVMGKESVEGELIGLSPERLTLRLASERCGQVNVHFPRVGYKVRRSQPT
ncbi:MAG TPA: glutathione S-transferase family protein [Aquabacterium sp.]|nr:glutathione S-transferase family protein [Aquabacterium sp.]